MKAIYTKLLSVQKKIGAISKDAENPFFKSKYFDINALIEHVKPVLNEEGLIVLQSLAHIEGKPAIETLIVDAESGEEVGHTTPLPVNDDPQKMGSAITYYRRYALVSLLFLNAEDDDGNKASKPQAKKYEDKPKSTGVKVDYDDGECTYSTGISGKTGKPWYMKKNKSTGEIDWLRDHEYDTVLEKAKAVPEEKPAAVELTVVDDPYSGLPF